MADDISPLDKVRRLFGRPTLSEQLDAEDADKAAKAKKAAAAKVAAENPRLPGNALRQRQETLDAALAELRRQSGTK